MKNCFFLVSKKPFLTISLVKVMELELSDGPKGVRLLYKPSTNALETQQLFTIYHGEDTICGDLFKKLKEAASKLKRIKRIKKKKAQLTDEKIINYILDKIFLKVVKNGQINGKKRYVVIFYVSNNTMGQEFLNIISEIIESYKSVLFSLFEHTNLLTIIDTVDTKSPENNCFIKIDYVIRIPNEGNTYFHKDRTIYSCLIFNNEMENNLISTEMTFYCSEKDEQSQQDFYNMNGFSNASVEKSFGPYMHEINEKIKEKNGPTTSVNTCKKIRFLLPMMYPIMAFFNYLLWHSTPTDTDIDRIILDYTTNVDGTIDRNYKNIQVQKCNDVVCIGNSSLLRESCFIGLNERLQKFVVINRMSTEISNTKSIIYILEYTRFVYVDKEENKTNIKEETIDGNNFSADLDAFYSKGFESDMLFTGGKKRCNRKTKDNKQKRTRKHMKKKSRIHMKNSTRKCYTPLLLKRR